MCEPLVNQSLPVTVHYLKCWSLQILTMWPNKVIITTSWFTSYTLIWLLHFSKSNANWKRLFNLNVTLKKRIQFIICSRIAYMWFTSNFKWVHILFHHFLSQYCHKADNLISNKKNLDIEFYQIVFSKQ